MSDKDLTIRIKSVGADEAAAAVHKVEAATDDLKASIPSNQKATIDIETTGTEQAVADIAKVQKAAKSEAANVEIKTTGTDKAVAEIGKVDKALEGVSNDSTVDIKTTGTAAAVAAVDKVDKAIGAVKPSASQAASALEKLGNEAKQLPPPIDRATRATDQLNRALADTKGKAHVAEFAHYDLGEKIKKTTVSTDTFTAGQTKLQTGTRNSSQALLMFSQGFEDAQYGIRGVLNNIPGLVIALGGTAGLAGGISIAAVALSQLGPLLSATGESAAELENKAQKTAEAIKEVATNMGELEGERFDTVIQEFEDLRAANEAVKDQVDLTKAADNAFALSALSNAAKIEGAIRILIASLGIQIDKTKELQALASAEQAQRELTTQQAIEVENAKLVKAREAQTTAADYLGTVEASLNVEKGRLVAQQARLEALREEKAVLENIAAGKGYDRLPTSMEDFAAKTRARPGSYAGYQGQIREEAGRQLNAQDFQAELQGTEQRVEELSAKIETQSRVITGMENALNLAIQSREDIEGAVGTKIEELNATLAADTTVAKVDAVRQTQEANAAKLTEVYSQIETANATGEAAKQTILAAAADGKVTADEQKSIADDVRVIIGLVQSGQASTKGNLQELINLQKQMAAQAANDANLIRQHSAQINQLYQRLR